MGWQLRPPLAFVAATQAWTDLTPGAKMGPSSPEYSPTEPITMGALAPLHDPPALGAAWPAPPGVPPPAPGTLLAPAAERAEAGFFPATAAEPVEPAFDPVPLALAGFAEPEPVPAATAGLPELTLPPGVGEP